MSSKTVFRLPAYVSTQNVYEAALDRIRWLWDEFDGDVYVCTSGGKDSTVVMELALIVARERGDLPLRVKWLDQECEFQSTVDYQRMTADRPEIDFRWYQVPFRLYNATNHEYPWLNVWGEGEEWVRPKEPDAITVNDFTNGRGKTIDRFRDLLHAIHKRDGGINLTGIRAEESPARRLMLTTRPIYKWVTWGGKGDQSAAKTPPFLMFHPIYDWSYRDIWKAMYDHEWKYNRMYDVQFQHGVPVRKMRVSNYHHETALHALEYLQEAEPETWERATARLGGVNAYGHLGREVLPDRLPHMFKSWREYMDYQIVHLVPDGEYRRMFEKMWKKVESTMPPEMHEPGAKRVAWATILNDAYGTTVDNWLLAARGTGPKPPSPEIAGRYEASDDAF